jgi:hypothetical protein
LAVAKQLDRLDPHAIRLTVQSPFPILATVDVAGHGDAFPRGDVPRFVRC